MKTIWVCTACGKVSKDRYGSKGTSKGWDESCFVNSVLVKEDHLVWNDTKTIVIEILDEGIIEKESSENK